jgi:hypothetical protein
VEQLADEDTAHDRERSVVLGEQKAKLERDTQDPLAQRDARKDAINEVRGLNRRRHGTGSIG